MLFFSFFVVGPGGGRWSPWVGCGEGEVEVEVVDIVGNGVWTGIEAFCILQASRGVVVEEEAFWSAQA